MKIYRTVLKKPFLGVVCSLCLLLASTPTLASGEHWQPIASEKLVRLPASYIDKAVERDFQESVLHDRIDALTETSQLHGNTLAELRDAIGLAEGDQRIDLRHQFLVKKSAYLDVMEERQVLHRKALTTRLRVYQSPAAKTQAEPLRRKRSGIDQSA